jgi:hypothetical protein
MKLIDFDGLFDEKLAIYIEQNKEKHTEKEWENIIPKLYKKFGDTKIPKIGCTPKEYYTRMSDTELVETLKAHLVQDVPVSEFLCTEIENRGVVDILLPLLDEESEEAVSYAINLIGEDEKAFHQYFTILTENRLTEDIRSDVTDILRAHADEVKEKAKSFYGQGIATEYMLEILSRVMVREDSIFELLLKEFRTFESVSTRAGYLAAYGDERALPYLLKRIEDKTIGFVEFQELKYAIEALGGEYNEPRDFSEDKDYIAIEAASDIEGNNLS